MKLMEKYRQLNEREQRLVLISGVVLIIALFYWVIWQPLSNSREQQQPRLESQSELLLWVQENAVRAQQLRRTSGNKVFSGSLPQAVNTSSARFNIAIARMQPQDDEIQVTVDEAPFNDVLGWLQNMEEMGILILQADLAEGNAPGMVRIRRLQLGK